MHGSTNQTKALVLGICQRAAMRSLGAHGKTQLGIVCCSTKSLILSLRLCARILSMLGDSTHVMRASTLNVCVLVECN